MDMQVEDDPLLQLAGTRRAGLTVSDAVWVAAAILHRSEPERDAFATEEIVARVRESCLTEAGEESVRTHVRQHCVANKKPQPNRACILFDVGRGQRRLLRSGDPVHPGRDAERRHPRWDRVVGFEELRQWYEEKWERRTSNEADPLLALVGTWRFGSADEYVASLRDNWGGVE